MRQRPEAPSAKETSRDPEAWVEALAALKRKKGLVRGGEPVPSFSLGLPAAFIQRLQQESAGVVEALMKVAHRILHGHPAFPTLAELGFSGPKRRLLARRLPEHHRDTLVIGRLDVTTDGERSHSYELNGSQPGGMEYLELFEHPLVAARFPRASFDRLYPTYLENALRTYRRQTGRGAPRGVLLLGHGYHLLATQREAFARQLDQPLHVAEDGAGCTYDGKELLWRGPRGGRHPVDLVLRTARASFERLLERPNGPILRAHARGHAVVVNPLAAKVVGWKTLYATVQDDRLLELADVTEAERHALRALLPAIAQVTTENAATFRREQDRWVLKYTLRGRGSQVWIGPETPARLWARQLERASRQVGWVCQRYAPPFRLGITLHDLAATALHVPASVDPYVTVGETVTVPAFLCRAVIPVHGDAAELEHVKLNLLGANRYLTPDGEERERTVGFGYVYPT